MPPEPSADCAPSEQIPVAQYVRMSTDHQKYSTACQLAAIRDYARARDLNLVRTYMDEAKSGVVLAGRLGLQALLHDVIAGNCGFKMILVYDVSRWGRFQDADESAHYEFLCRRAGIGVHYCAEPFDNDGSPMAALVKSIKRTMAGEFSRELSVKVSLGQSKATELGFWCAGPAPYGYRRCVVDRSGQPKQILQAGERKGLADDRVVLVLGPQSEINTVRLMFRLFVEVRLGCIEIARRLNARAIPTMGGGPWTDAILRGMLRNELYLGTGIYGKTSKKLKTRTVAVPKKDWIRKENAFPAIVSRSQFDRAGRRFAHPIPMASRAEMLGKLRELLAREGRLTINRIAAEPGMPTTYGIKARFGAFRLLYDALGYGGTVAPELVRLRTFALDLRTKVVAELVGHLRRSGYSVEKPPRSSCLIIQGMIRLTVTVSRAHPAAGGRDRFWSVRLKSRVPSEVVLVICVHGDPAKIVTYYLISRSLMPEYCMRLPSTGADWSADCRCNDFGQVIGALNSHLAVAGYVRP